MKNDSLLRTSLAPLLVAFVLLTSLPKSNAESSTTNATPAQVLIGAPYRQTNLVSDLPGVALVEDRPLRNPWGVALTANSPFWVANNKTGTASIYKGDVGGGPLAPPFSSAVSILNVPTLLPSPTSPT